MRSPPTLPPPQNLKSALGPARVKIESNMMIYSLKPLSIQPYLKHFHLGVQNSVYYNRMLSQPQFHATM